MLTASQIASGHCSDEVRSEAIHLPSLFSIMFSIPDIDSQGAVPLMDMKSVVFDQSRYLRERWDGDSRAEMVCHLLREISSSDDLMVQLSYLRALDPNTKSLLKNTVLLNEALIAYYFLIYRYTDCITMFDVSTWVRSEVDKKKYLLEATRFLTSSLS